jgi:hypothetical protein
VSSESAEIFGNGGSKGGNVGVNGAINCALNAPIIEILVALVDDLI